MQSIDTPAYEEHIDSTEQLIEKIIKLYDLSPGSTMRLLNYSENTTYLVEDKEGDTRTVLRVNRPGYHSKEEIEAELAWMKDISENCAINVPEPIRGKDGEYVQTLKNDVQSKQYCVMISFLNGKAPDEQGEENLITQFEILGEVTAQLHNHVQNWESSAGLDRFTWDYETMLGDDGRWGRWQEGPDVTPGRAELFQKVSDTINTRLADFGKGRDRFGLIHADLRLANLLVEEDKINVIDFDDCGFGWFLYDLAAALSFIEHNEYVPDLIESWLKGYCKVRPLSEEEKAEIPTFILLRRLILLAWLGTHSDSDTARELGADFAVNTVRLAEKYLLNFG